MWSDLRSALRNLRAAPGYTAAATLTLALAIAANTGIFGVVYAILLRPLPIHDPDRLVVVWESSASSGLPVLELAYRQFETWARHGQSFERLAAMGSSSWPMVLEGQGDPTKVPSVAVSSSFFDTLGASAALGSVFTPDDDKGVRGDVVVLSHGMWVRRFGGNQDIIGRSVTLDRRPYTVVGVMPRDFDFPRGTEVWRPVVPVLVRSGVEWKADALSNVRVLYVIGRLRPGVRIEAARDEVSALSARFSTAGIQPDGAVVTSLLDYTLGPLREGLWWLLGAVGVLLLVACANVSGLTLTRAAVRRREHAIRRALGASQLHIGRMWLAECAAIGVAGGLSGVLAARWLLAVVVALAPEDVPRIDDLGVSVPVAMFTLVLTLAATCLCAASAVLHTSSGRVGDVLGETVRATANPRSTRARTTLVVAQIALAVVLLVSAGLVVRSFATLQRLDVGYDPTNVLTLAVDPASAEMPARAWFREITERIERLPGVDSAGAVFLRPLAFGAIGSETTMLYEGQGGTPEKAIADGAKNPKLNFQVATPGYFKAMRIPLLRGRLFNERDREGSPRVVVIGEQAARRLWPRQDPIGKRLNTPQHSGGVAGNAWHTVVGVVKDVHYRGINDVRSDLYEPASQSLKGPEFLVVRTTVDPLTIVAAVQAQIRAYDRGAVVSGVTTMEAVLGRALAPWRLSSWMLTLFAAFAFVLAIVGLVGLIGLDVAQRLREFAVRVALGAEARHVRAHVYRSAAIRAGAGLSIGIAGALAVTQWLRALLFGVSPVDPLTYAAVAAGVGLTVLLVSLVPAARAARVDPVEILKRE